MDTFDDQFHRLVQVLDTLGHIDEHVGALDVLDILCLVLFHARLDEDITASRGSAGSWRPRRS